MGLVWYNIQNYHVFAYKLLVYLKVVYILFIIKIIPIDKYTFFASAFGQMENILDHNPFDTSAFL